MQNEGIFFIHVAYQEAPAVIITCQVHLSEHKVVCFLILLLVTRSLEDTII